MKRKIQFVICLLVGLMYINSGLNKIFNYLPMPADLPPNMLNVMNAFNTIGWLLPLVAVAEIVGGIFFILPRFRALGAIILFPVSIGIVLTHVADAPIGTPFALVFLLVNLWIIIDSRQKYQPMILREEKPAV